ncbi:hypothetical protein [Vibrio sp. B1Z05]|uniref:hypothetical protein n=1 Tax=Vibrio sp. B1Z05 TaxID=2654980 RepID=UPI00128DCFB2|nr:hypothetical protein [Vibrio sp. B1Z05]MPW37642.1 hypothetical protein [Vibrio sp. B1Z05]
MKKQLAIIALLTSTSSVADIRDVSDCTQVGKLARVFMELAQYQNSLTDIFETATPPLTEKEAEMLFDAFEQPRIKEGKYLDIPQANAFSNKWFLKCIKSNQY